MADYRFGLGLQQRFSRAGVRASSLIAHPGLSNTDLQARSVREDSAGWAGELYAPRFGSNRPAVRRPVLRRFDLQKQIDVLWQVSERETGIPLDVAAVLSRA